jgi:hypothetical protein
LESLDSVSRAGLRHRKYLAWAAVLLVVGGFAAWWLWPSPTPPAFGAGGIGISGPAVVGEDYYVSPVASSLRTVRVNSVTPILANGSAPAATFVLVCDPKSEEGISQTLTMCHHAAPFHSFVLRPTDGGSTAVGIIPLAPGTIRIIGFKVEYQAGGNRTAVTRAQIVLTVRSR